MGDRTMIDFLLTAITDIRSFIKAFASFLFKILAGLVTSWAGGALHTAEKDLSTSIRFLTMTAMNTKVFSVVEGAL